MRNAHCVPAGVLNSGVSSTRQDTHFRFSAPWAVPACHLEWALERCVAHGQHPSGKGICTKAATPAKADFMKATALFLDFISAWTGIWLLLISPQYVRHGSYDDVAGVHKTAGTSDFGSTQIPSLGGFGPAGRRRLMVYGTRTNTISLARFDSGTARKITHFGVIQSGR